MVNQETLHEVVSRCVRIYHPLQIYLYGSQAWGNPADESDIDLCIIIKESDKTHAERIRDGLRALSGISIPVDLLVFTEKEIEARINHPSTLIHKIYTLGKKLYEAA